MKRLAFLFLFLLLAVVAFAEVSDVVLKGLVDRNVVVTRGDGSELSGQLTTYNAASAVIITAGGEVIEIARKDMNAIRAIQGPSTASTATTASSASSASSEDKPRPPDFSSLRGRTPAELQAAYDAQFKLYADPVTTAFKMGANNRFYPLAQWDSVFKEVPEAYKQYKSYRGHVTTSLSFLIAGNVLLIPGMVMSMLGPFVVGIAFDLAALTCDIIALVSLPKKDDFLKIADTYNANTLKALQLGSAWPSESILMAMRLDTIDPGETGRIELALLSLEF